MSISDLSKNKVSFNIWCQHSLVHHYMTSYVKWQFLCGSFAGVKELNMLNCNSAGTCLISKRFVTTQVLTKLVLISLLSIKTCTAQRVPSASPLWELPSEGNTTHQPLPGQMARQQKPAAFLPRFRMEKKPQTSGLVRHHNGTVTEQSSVYTGYGK